MCSAHWAGLDSPPHDSCSVETVSTFDQNTGDGFYALRSGQFPVVAANVRTGHAACDLGFRGCK